MKIVKIIDFILLLAIVIVGMACEIYPYAIPTPFIYAFWIAGAVAIILFGIILFIEKKTKE